MLKAEYKTGDHIVVPHHITSTYPYSENGDWPGANSGEYLEQLTVLSFLAAHPSMKA